MKDIVRFSLLLLLLPVLAFAQGDPTPVVTNISPAAGLTGGGTEVRITGRNLVAKINCILPCPTKVSFGGAEVITQSETDTQLVVLTPAHAAGTVNVTVRLADARSTTVRNGFTFGSTAELAYSKVLFPVYLDGTISGANGTRWQTDLWIRNNGSESVALAPWECPINSACPAVFPLTRNLLAGESIRNLPAFFRPPSANPGRVLFVSRTGVDEVAFQLRFADVSRGSLNGGTELPAVREGDFFTRKLTLLNVPFDGRFRVLLRVYDVANTSARFRVNFYAQAEGAGNQLEHSTEIVAITAQTGDFRDQPAYVQYDFNSLLQLPRVWPAALRVEIEPLTPGSQFWSFVSVTNNDTQLVTLITPQ